MDYNLETIKNTIRVQIQKEVEVQAVLATNQREANMYPDITKMIKKVPVEFID